MSHSPVQFGPFQLDLADRRLSRGGMTIDLSTRYMDALILLVRAEGKLVAKDRFMDEVWCGVPVTDEALTQAIRTLRRALGDSATTPQFIETVPKHGYRFIAPINAAARTDRDAGDIVQETRYGIEPPYPVFTRLALAGLGGAIGAGALVGLSYGMLGAAQPSGGGSGASMSILLVLILVSMFSAGVAGAGIAAGIAASRFIRPLKPHWTVIGGSLGGMTVGAFANLLGNDVFRLLFGRAPGVFAGALEGVVLGGAIGLATLFRGGGLVPRLSVAALLGVGAGILVALVNGRMMAGSLQELVSAFPTSRYRLDGIGQMFGEEGLGPVGRAVTAAFEGAVFSVGMVWALSRTDGESHAVRRSRDQSEFRPKV